MKIILLGAKGRLGLSLSRSLKEEYDLKAFSKQEVNILDSKIVSKAFREFFPDLVINCSGYTDVNGAEKNPSFAVDVNVIGIKNLCAACAEFDVPLVHFSTDYVYGGGNVLPYTEEDSPSPLNVYGQTKWQGECFIKEHLKKYVIFRSCWLYSTEGRSFLNLVMDADKAQRDLTIVDDQIGSPTSIPLLIMAVKRWIQTLSDNGSFGTYHISSTGACSWFTFACEIKRQLNLSLEIIPISTDAFNIKNPGQANRPRFSALNPGKFSEEFSFEIMDWKNTLKNYLITL